MAQVVELMLIKREIIMTTIAYNHKDKEIAFDSRSTSNGIIISNTKNKALKVFDVMYIGSGDDDHIKSLVSVLSGQSQVGDITSNQAIVYWLLGGAAFKSGYNIDDGVWTQELECNEAIGSGFQWALAAMDFGCVAKDAVKYAMTRDMHTGGKIKVIKVK